MERQNHSALSALLNIRAASDGDLIQLEWQGEYRHFRRLYQDIYASSKKGDAILWVVELNGSGVIGQAFVQLTSARKDLADGSYRAYLYGFRVHPRFRNQGIGSYVLQFVEADLYRRSFTKVCLNVGRENHEARRLYHRHGYRIVGMEAGEWSYLDENGLRQYIHEPAWRMEKSLRD